MNTLNEFVTHAVNNNVDFEIWHGKTTNKTESVRTHMLIKLWDCPAVVATFGDEKHGKRLSMLTLSVNRNIAVNVDDLFTAMGEQSTLNEWKRDFDEMSDISAPNFDNLNIIHTPNREISLVGTASDNGTFLVRNQYITMDGNVHNSTDTVYRLNAGTLGVPTNEKVVIFGTYQFPNYINVTDVVPA